MSPRRRPPDVASDATAQLLTRGSEEHYLDTALYDFEYRRQKADIEWYLALAAARGTTRPVVELGIGTGRIALPLARAGHRVAGVDRMESMLAALRRKLEGEPPEVAARIELLAAEITELPLRAGTADLVIAPFNVLQHLYRWEDLLACFREAYRVLSPGGAFAFDVLLPDLEWLLWNADKRHSTTRFVHPTSRERMIYTTNHTYDHETQICHIRIYYDRAPARGGRFRPPESPVRLVHLAHRQIFPEELRALLATAGFELESLSGDFQDLPLRAGVESQVGLARKPARTSRRA